MNSPLVVVVKNQEGTHTLVNINVLFMFHNNKNRFYNLSFCLACMILLMMASVQVFILRHMTDGLHHFGIGFPFLL